MINNKQQR